MRGKDKKGKTPLMLAEGRKYKHIISFLQQKMSFRSSVNFQYKTVSSELTDSNMAVLSGVYCLGHMTDPSMLCGSM